ncbi:hypothetical protein SAMN05421803_11592 [Nocardiopsis flavescens]|uniref:Uncharacterized protein n=1 Tax=Nocardiopsis flavescens TaxID=758803 RepID=A0A1M6QJX6_9ACTN|nr:hypothetical protein SAMN05421803_11592 [Nocardiopsis flavescens]
MLGKAKSDAKLDPGQVKSLGVARTTWQKWLDGSVPDQTEKFLSVVRRLEQVIGHPVYPEALWRETLRAAQEERAQEANAGRRHSALARTKAEAEKKAKEKGGPGFVSDHSTTLCLSVPDTVRGRENERTIMNAFVKASGPEAPSYRCWQAEAPVGKSVLLADYIRRYPPPKCDILSFFVSPAEGTDTRASFAEELAGQIHKLFDREKRVPHNVRGWRQLFAEAAQKSKDLGRRLVLIVDGLDDDVAWSGLKGEDGAPTAGAREPAEHELAPGSIAALLPAAPPSGMRVIVSLRRSVRLPDDIPEKRHPLRQAENFHELRPVAGLAPAERSPAPPTDPLGRPVAELLAVAGGGLRVQDLAELTGLPGERIDRLFAGPAGRAVVLDDPVRQTYALAGSGLVDAVRAGLGDAGVLRRTGELLSWSRAWGARGWPDGTPPFPLKQQLRLLTDDAERTAYALDLPRLRRLSATFGPDVALGRLTAFADEAGPDGTAEGLAKLIPLSAVRALVRRESREVPDGSPALFVRLGVAERARALARSAPTPILRAVHLAEAAAQMADAGIPGVDAVVGEAAEWLDGDRVDRGSPGAHREAGPYERLLGSAATLMKLHDRGTARPLLLAVAHDPAADSALLVRAAGLLAADRDPATVEALFGRAQTLSMGNTRAQAAAVDLWGALARAVPDRGPEAGDLIQAVCEAVDPADELEKVDVLIAGISALANLPAKRSRQAVKLKHRAEARIVEAITTFEERPEELSEEDRAHLRRGMGGTLARFAQAVSEAGITRASLDDAASLWAPWIDGDRRGSLGEPLAERAQGVVESIQAGWAESDARTSTPKKTKNRSEDRSDRDEPAHLSLLREAEEQQEKGNLSRGRELLEECLRRRPVPEAPLPVPGPWTVELCHALGLAGEFPPAEAVVADLSDTGSRARHLGSLSLGCSLGGFREAGARYAREAADLVSDSGEAGLRNTVAQALAHAGDGAAASAMATGGSAAQERQAMTAVAAGLARHRPDEAERMAVPLVEALAGRIAPGSPLRVLPELAALLLAFPDIRAPEPRLRDALHRAVQHLAGSPMSPPAPSLVVLALLEQLGCLTEEDGDTVTGLRDRWRRSHRSAQDHSAELVLYAAMEGDTAALWRRADAVPTPRARSEALGAAAAYLAGAPAALSTDGRAGDRVLRTCLALARAAADGAPPDEETARDIVRGLAEADVWPHTIPVLPLLAPDALPRLVALAGDPAWGAGGPDTAGGPSLP